VYDTYISAVHTVLVFHYTKRFIVTRKVVNRGHLHGPKTTDTFRIIACNSIQKFNISLRGRSPSVSRKICTHLIWDQTQNLVNDSPLSHPQSSRLLQFNITVCLYCRDDGLLVSVLAYNSNSSEVQSQPSASVSE